MKQQLAVVFSMLILSIHAFAQEIEVITFEENFKSDATYVIDAPLRDKDVRKSDSFGGQIEVKYPESLPDSIAKAIDAAVELWEECLPLDAKVNLNVSFVNISSDMRVEVSYLECENDTLYALSYYRSYIERNFKPDKYDGYVYFSDAVKWCCNYSQNISGAENITAAMLRTIAITLGFGSTIKQNERGDVYFQHIGQDYTYFEYLVTNNVGIPLSSIGKDTKNRDNPALHSYCEPTGTMWLKWDDKQYKLYAPQTFVRDKSMIYLDNPKSLMHHEMPSGSSYLDIDSTTIDIIRALGWKNTYPSRRIYCKDIPETGIASAYKSYLFEIKNYDTDMSSLHWEFQTRTDEGEYHTVSQQSDGQTFLVDPSPYLSSSRVNPEGDIDAKIILTYTLGDVERRSVLKLTLECAPKILGVYDQTVHSNGYYTYYDYSFSVSYRGATSITLGVEEEFSPWYKIIRINEPFLAHAYLKYLSRGNMVRVEISAENKYGTDTYIIEIPVQEPDAIGEVSADNSYSITSVDHIDVYSPNGVLLKRIRSISELSGFHSRTLLLQYFDGEGREIQTKKVNLK